MSSKQFPEIRIPVSVGELCDKITILAIKLDRIKDSTKLAALRREKAALERELEKIPRAQETQFVATMEQLREINGKLWDVEDAIRDKEAAKSFDADFIALARSVYRLNDQRSVLKNRLNELSGSLFQEVKSYHPYD